MSRDQLVDFGAALTELEVNDWSGALPLQGNPLLLKRHQWRRPLIEISFEVIQHRTSGGTLVRKIYLSRGVYQVL